MQLLSPDDIDDRARTIAREYLAGERTVDSAHVACAALIYQSNVPATVASVFARGRPMSRQAVEDLATRLRDLAVNKVLIDPETGVSYLSIERLVTSSFTGWMRQTLKACALSAARDLARYNRRVPLTLSGDERSLYEPTESDPHEQLQRTAAELAASRYAAVSASAKPLARLQLQAAALTQMFALPPVARPLDSTQRATVSGAGAQEVFSVVSALADGRSVTSPIASLFTGWGPQDLEALTEIDPRVCHTLVLAAAAAVPPQPKRISDALRSSFAQTCSGREQLALAPLVVSAWLTSSTTIIGDEHNGWVSKADEQQADELARFTYHAHRLVLAGHSCATVAEISSLLYALTDSIAAQQCGVPLDRPALSA